MLEQWCASLWHARSFHEDWQALNELRRSWLPCYRWYACTPQFVIAAECALSFSCLFRVISSFPRVEAPAGILPHNIQRQMSTTAASSFHFWICTDVGYEGCTPSKSGQFCNMWCVRRFLLHFIIVSCLCVATLLPLTCMLRRCLCVDPYFVPTSLDVLYLRCVTLPGTDVVVEIFGVFLWSLV